MTKTELVETYTEEQLADKIIELETIIDDKLGGWNKHGISYNELFAMRDKIEKLQSEVEKYHKAFEDANNELKDLEIKIEEEYKPLEIEVEALRKNERELSEENAELHSKIERSGNISDFLPTEPIKVADMLINVMCEPCASVLSFGKPYSMYDMSELRQIAEHLLVYCNHHVEVEE